MLNWLKKEKEQPVARRSAAVKSPTNADSDDSAGSYMWPSTDGIEVQELSMTEFMQLYKGGNTGPFPR